MPRLGPDHHGARSRTHKQEWGRWRPADVGFSVNTGRAEGLLGTGDNCHERKSEPTISMPPLSELSRSQDDSLPEDAIDSRAPPAVSFILWQTLEGGSAVANSARRKLAAILAANAVGYVRLARVDEASTHCRLSQLSRRHHRPNRPPQRQGHALCRQRCAGGRDNPVTFSKAR